MYAIIYKVEFVSLLNYHSLRLDWSSRLVGADGDLSKDSIVNRLLLMPRFDLEEDLLIVRLKDQDDYSKAIHLSEFIELLPLSDRSLMAYRRKFDDNLNFSESKLVFDSVSELKNIQLKKDIDQILVILAKDFFNKKDVDLKEKDFFYSLVDPIYQRRYLGKQDSDIEKGELANVFQAITLYQQGSHILRATPIDYIYIYIYIYIYSKYRM